MMCREAYSQTGPTLHRQPSRGSQHWGCCSAAVVGQLGPSQPRSVVAVAGAGWPAAGGGVGWCAVLRPHQQARTVAGGRSRLDPRRIENLQEGAWEGGRSRAARQRKETILEASVMCRRTVGEEESSHVHTCCQSAFDGPKPRYARIGSGSVRDSTMYTTPLVEPCAAAVEASAQIASSKATIGIATPSIVGSDDLKFYCPYSVLNLYFELVLFF